MAMKCCIVSAAAGTGTTPFNQDFTDSGVFGGSTPVAAIFLGGGTGSADTATDGAQFQLGATDGTSYGAISFASDTSSAASNVGRSCRSDAAYVNIGNTGSVVGLATASLIPDGARLTWSNESATETIAALLIGGDIAAKLVSWSSPGGTGEKTITHGLGGTPEVIIAFSAGTVDATNDSNSVSPCIGFWASGGQIGYGHRIADNSATAAVTGRLSTTTAVISMAGGGTNYTADIRNVGATTFGLNFDASTTNRIHFLCLRSTTASALVASVGNFAAKTSTGTQADISGMSVTPAIMLTLPTALTTTDSNSTTDPAGNFGIGVAVRKSSDYTSQYASVQHGADDGTATTNDWMNHQRSASKHINQLDTAGASAVVATVSTWDAGGITHNYGTASGTAVQIGYLAFGAASDAASTPKARMLMTGVG